MPLNMLRLELMPMNMVGTCSMPKELRLAPCMHGVTNCAHALVDAESFLCLQPDWPPKACMVA